MFYVYQHVRKDLSQPFYVGKGKCRRAYQVKGRTKYWKHIADKAGYFVDFLVKDVDEEFAFLVEQETIDVYRRRNLKLVNLTEGGEGCSGRKASSATIEKLRNANLGKKRSDEARRNMSIAKFGTTLTSATKEKISLSHLGVTTWNKGLTYSLPPMSEQGRLNISKAQKGMKRSDASNLKRSQALKGKPKSEETRKRMALAQQDPERKKKQSERMKAFRAKQRLENPPVSPTTQPLPWATS